MTVWSDDDARRFADGTHDGLHHVLGAHRVDGGMRVATWAPNASAVSLIGDVNDWDVDAHPLRRRDDGSGTWHVEVEGMAPPQAYKLHVVGPDGEAQDHADPFAVHAETPPASASKAWDLDHDWTDDAWMEARGDRQGRDRPLVIHEAHLGSWQRGEDGTRFLTYREVAPKLAEHAQRMGATHVELLPLAEHPFYGSWGYLPTGHFAPTSRYGTPQDLMFLVDTLHAAELGVIVDWVPAHFPDDPWGLAMFDGTPTFAPSDPLRRRLSAWSSLAFDHSRGEVRSFLRSSATAWLERYHVDGLRFDAVAAIVWRDHGRDEDQWEPNPDGSAEDREGIAFLRGVNDALAERHPDVLLIAEETTSFPGVTAPTSDDGLGFDLKWDTGWMHDIVAYFGREPAERPEVHDRLTFRSVYASKEAFVLPLSHDDVAHPHPAVKSKLPGDDGQQLADLRALLAMQFLTPGKKLLFMGTEFGVREPWQAEEGLDWSLLELAEHASLLDYVGELSRLHRELPALHQGDAHDGGFAWISADDRDQSIVAWRRRAPDQPEVVVVANLQDATREGYGVGVPHGGGWRVLLDSDEERWGGRGRGPGGTVSAAGYGSNGLADTLLLTLPPRTVLALAPEG